MDTASATEHKPPAHHEILALRYCSPREGNSTIVTHLAEFGLAHLVGAKAAQSFRIVASAPAAPTTRTPNGEVACTDLESNLSDFGEKRP